MKINAGQLIRVTRSALIWLWVLVLLCLLLKYQTAHAQGPIDATWVNETHYNDCTDTACDNGSPLAATAITSGVMQYGTCVGLGTAMPGISPVLGSVTVQGGQTHATSPNVPAGTYCVQVANFVGSVQSEITNPAQVTIPVVTPAGFSTTTTLVYLPVLGHDRLTFLIVGSLPLKTPCDQTQPDGPFFVVPVASVSQWQSPYNTPGAAKPTTVVAACAAQ